MSLFNELGVFGDSVFLGIEIDSSNVIYVLALYLGDVLDDALESLLVEMVLLLLLLRHLVIFNHH